MKNKAQSGDIVKIQRGLACEIRLAFMQLKGGPSARLKDSRFVTRWQKLLRVHAPFMGFPEETHTTALDQILYRP